MRSAYLDRSDGMNYADLISLKWTNSGIVI